MKTSDLRDIMRIAWQLVRKNGFTMSEALKTAWLNFKLKMKMRYGTSSSTTRKYPVRFVRHTALCAPILCLRQKARIASPILLFRSIMIRNAMDTAVSRLPTL